MGIGMGMGMGSSHFESRAPVYQAEQFAANIATYNAVDVQKRLLGGKCQEIKDLLSGLIKKKQKIRNSTCAPKRQRCVSQVVGSNGPGEGGGAQHREQETIHYALPLTNLETESLYALQLLNKLEMELRYFISMIDRISTKADELTA